MNNDSTLRGFRKLARPTQDELRQKVGIDQARISRIENGHIPPSRRERTALAQVLGIPEEVLFPGKKQ